jgi:hypothetical protein
MCNKNLHFVIHGNFQGLDYTLNYMPFIELSFH